MTNPCDLRISFQRRLQPTGLYVLFDPRTRRDWREQVTALADAGVAVMQLRAKGASRTQLEAWAEKLYKNSALSASVVLNDLPDVAAELGFAGVHVGANDASPSVARAVVGAAAVVGASANTAQRLQALDAADIDYVGVGAFRATASKSDASRILGLAGTRDLLAATKWPVVAIGGIAPADLTSLRQAGVAGVAVYSAIWLAERPAAAAVEFAKAWQAAA